MFITRHLTLLQFCKNDLWYKHNLVGLLFRTTHHRWLLLRKNEPQVLLICLVTAVMAAKTSKEEAMKVMINIHSPS